MLLNWVDLKISRAYYNKWLKTNPILLNLLVNSSLSVDTIRGSVAMINVYYEDLHYGYSMENPLVDFSTLLGTVGKIMFLYYIIKWATVKL